MGQSRDLKLSILTTFGALFVFYLASEILVQTLLFFGVQLDLHESGHVHFGNWTLVGIYVVTLAFFTLAYAVPKRVHDWRSMGLLQGFIVALYFEMYGIPLTIYALAALIGRRMAPTHANGHLVARLLGPVVSFETAGPLIMLISSILMLIAFGLVFLGWRQIYLGGGRLVTDGIYRFVRHPQYVGFVLLTIALLLHWPTIVTVIMWPILVYSYRRLAFKEEDRLREEFGRDYEDYIDQTPRFRPRLAR